MQQSHAKMEFIRPFGKFEFSIVPFGLVPSTSQHILKYPDLEKPYVLFTDASKYGWAGVLTLPYEEFNELT